MFLVPWGPRRPSIIVSHDISDMISVTCTLTEVHSLHKAFFLAVLCSVVWDKQRIALSHAPRCVSPHRQLLVNADILTVCIALLSLNAAILTSGQEAAHITIVFQKHLISCITPYYQGPARASACGLAPLPALWGSGRLENGVVTCYSDPVATKGEHAKDRPSHSART